jgi:hypothetical protein
MKKTKFPSEAKRYATGGTWLVVTSLIAGGFALHAYHFGTDEMIVHTATHGTRMAPATEPHDYGFLFPLYMSIGIGVVGILMWLTGLIIKLEKGSA